jgi:hypothetical protein
MFGEYRCCNFLWHFKAEAQVRGRSKKQFLPERGTWKLIEGKVAAHRGKHLGVLRQTFLLEIVL